MEIQSVPYKICFYRAQYFSLCAVRRPQVTTSSTPLIKEVLGTKIKIRAASARMTSDFISSRYIGMHVDTGSDRAAGHHQVPKNTSISCPNDYFLLQPL